MKKLQLKINGADKPNSHAHEPGRRSGARSPFFSKVWVPTAIAIMAVAFSVGGAGCLPKPTAPGYEMTAAKKVELSETKEYMQKPMVDADYQCADDPLISVNTTIVIPEKICVKVSKNREYVYSEGIESGKEHWRYGVEEGGILLPDGSRFSIINDHVYMATCDAQLIKIGARAGEEVWRQDYYGEFDSQPRLAMQSGVKVIIVTDGSKTYVIDPANGNLALLE